MSLIRVLSDPKSLTPIPAISGFACSVVLWEVLQFSVGLDEDISGYEGCRSYRSTRLALSYCEMLQFNDQVRLIYDQAEEVSGQVDGSAV